MEQYKKCVRVNTAKKQECNMKRVQHESTNRQKMQPKKSTT